MIKYLFLVLFTLLSLPIYGRDTTYVANYTYRAGETDSKVTARQNALTQLKKQVLEQVGIYIHSTFNDKASEQERYGTTVSKAYTESDLETVSGGITRVEILNEEWNGEEFFLRAAVTLDPDEIHRRLQEFSKRKTASQFCSRIELTLASEMNSVVPSLNSYRNVIRLDVKTSYIEKANITEAKNGCINYLNQIPSVMIAETGEDYSIWIRDYDSKINNNNVIITADLQIRTPSFIRDGRLLKEHKVRITYNPSEKFSLKADKRFTEWQDGSIEANYAGYLMAKEFERMLFELK